MAIKSIYTKELGEAVAREARSTRRVLHIISRLPDKWVLVSNGRKRAIKIFPSQRQAVSFAKKSVDAKSIEEIVVHTKQGLVKETISYPENAKS